MSTFKKTEDVKVSSSLYKLGLPGAMLACNQNLVEETRKKLTLPSDDTKRVDELLRLYKDTSMVNQRDVSRMPTKIRGQFVSRLQNELMVDLIAQQFCVMDTIQWGESYQYSTLARGKLPIYKLSEPGGKPKSYGWSNEEGIVDLGSPIFYITEEFVIPHFNRNAPDKWMRELDRAVTWAKQDLADQIDQDLWTAIDGQISGGLTQTGFSYLDSRVKNTPTSNNLVLADLTAGISRQAVQDLLMHGLRMNRRLVRTVIPTLAMETVWDWINADTYHPRISDELQAEIERTGGKTLNMWGYPVVFQPTNVLEGSTAPLYAYASYEPLDPATVPGAVFYVVAQSNEDESYDFLRLVRSEPRWDVFVASIAVLIADIDYQKPNVARLRYE